MQILIVKGGRGQGKERGTEAKNSSLLHDTGLALGECDMPTTFVLDEVDFDLATSLLVLLATVALILLVFLLLRNWQFDVALFLTGHVK